MTCTRCGQELPSPAPPFCPNCGAAILVPAGGPVGAGPVEPEAGPRRDGPAWERRKSVLDVGAMVDTVAKVLFEAPATFRSMRQTGGLGGPVLYAVILGTVFGWIAIGWDMLISSFTENLIPAGESPFGDLPVGKGTLRIAYALLLPVLIPIVVLIWAGILHLFLMVYGGARQSFETTARVVCYTSGSTTVFNAIPLCGGLIGLIWGIIVSIIGLAEAHETSTGRAAGAFLTPFLLCCLCVVGVIALGVAGMLSFLNR